MTKPAQVPPLAIVMLLALGCAPLFVIGKGYWDQRQVRQRAIERDAVVVAPGGGRASPQGPTIGMSVDTDGMGTITVAPEDVAHKSDARSWPTVTAGSIAADLRAFIRGLPAPAPSPRKAEPMMCTLEGPPSWTGRLVLVKGCLRLQIDGENGPGPLILGATELHRDEQGYLVASLGGGPPEGHVRVGAPNVTFTGVGCSMDRPVRAPPAFAKACGVATMRRVSRMERGHYCTPEEAEGRRRRETENAAMQARLAAAREVCLDRGGTAQGCPPGVGPIEPPPPPPGSVSGCVPEPR